MPRFSDAQSAAQQVEPDCKLKPPLHAEHALRLLQALHDAGQDEQLEVGSPEPKYPVLQAPQLPALAAQATRCSTLQFWLQHCPLAKKKLAAQLEHEVGLEHALH